MPDPDEILFMYKEFLRPELVKHIAEDLFLIGREEELRASVLRCVQGDFAVQNLLPAPDWRHALVESLMLDIYHDGREGLLAHAGESPDERFIRIFKRQVRPALAQELPDALFEAGREVELQAQVVRLVDARIQAHKISVSPKLREAFLDSLKADIEQAQREWADFQY